MKITAETILADIAGYQSRIDTAMGKLAGLLDGRLPYPEHKKREKQRRQLEDDVRHLRKLRDYAAGALNEYSIA